MSREIRCDREEDFYWKNFKIKKQIILCALSSLGDKAQTYRAIASAVTVAAERISLRLR